MELTKRQNLLCLDFVFLNLIQRLRFLESNLDWMNEERESESLGKISSEEIWETEELFKNA